jgi:hypothetical protein
MDRDNDLNTLRYPRVLRLLTGLLAVLPAVAATSSAPIEQQFTQTVQPFVKQYCFACHSGAKPAASSI